MFTKPCYEFDRMLFEIIPIFRSGVIAEFPDNIINYRFFLIRNYVEDSASRSLGDKQVL